MNASMVSKRAFSVAAALALAVAVLACFVPPVAHAAQTGGQSAFAANINAQGATAKAGLAAGSIQAQDYILSNDYWDMYCDGADVYVSSYKGDAPDVAIPGSITDTDGKTYQVKGIDPDAFYGLPITRVDIPVSVYYIDESAFAGCTSLTTVTGGAGLKYIESDAFAGCVRLSSFPLGKKLVYIGAGAFSGSGVTVAKYPGYLADDGTGAYRPCTAQLYIKGKKRGKAKITATAKRGTLMVKKTVKVC